VRLFVTSSRLAVCRLAADAIVPAWPRGTFVSITRTPQELSIVCDEEVVPADVQAERGWRALQLEGPIPFETTGVAAGLANALSAKKISLFLVSTYDTDWVLVKEASLDAAMAALREAGYELASC
jgi:hypothetical protein